MRMNKKGSGFDVMQIAIILLTFSMLLLIGYKVLTELDTQFQSHSEIPAPAKTASTTLLSYYPGVLDNSFLFLTIGLAIVTLVLASLVRVHPAFLIFFFIALLFFIIVSGALSNVYQEMASNPQFSALASNLLFTSAVMNYLPFIVGILGIILSIVMYKTWENG